MAIDILRVIQEEANLMKETEEVRDAITSDPYENLGGIPLKALERFKKTLRVAGCDRQRCGSDFARIHATVTLSNDPSNAKLIFTYERKPRRGGLPNETGHHPCDVSYSIDLGNDHEERQRLLDVTVRAASNVPSSEPAVCIQDKLDEEWEDTDEDEEIEKDDQQTVESPSSIQLKKKQRTHSDADNTKNIEADEVEENDSADSTRDEYIAFLDPDVMLSFLESAGLHPMDDGTAFFLLMTFPFFEHEWDIVGFVLDQIFGGETDDEEELQ
jgi:hypothetical protein